MRIIETLKEKNKKQIDLANYLGISKSTMSLYASGKREPDVATLIRIADYFGVSVDYLIGHDSPNLKPQKKMSLKVNEKTIPLKSGDILTIKSGDISLEMHVSEM